MSVVTSIDPLMTECARIRAVRARLAALTAEQRRCSPRRRWLANSVTRIRLALGMIRSHLEGLRRSWVILSGRGWGKTRTLTGACHIAVRAGISQFGIIAPTAADIRDVIVEGPAGLLATASDAARPVYEPSKRRVTWPTVLSGCCSAGRILESLRGPEHELVAIDELAAIPAAPAILDQVRLSLRLGTRPRFLIATTPRPHPWLKRMVADSDVTITTGTSMDNRANLSEDYFRALENCAARDWGDRKFTVRSCATSLMPSSTPIGCSGGSYRTNSRSTKSFRSALALILVAAGRMRSA